MNSTSDIDATIVITTKNRKDELSNAVESALNQRAKVEVIVIDDGSTDGTSDFVKSRYPTVRLITHPVSVGLIVSRNEGAALSLSEFIFSIDDDAIFTSPEVVSQTLRDFADERIGAVAIPYSDVNRDGVVRQKSPDDGEIWITDRFVGTAHALRRSVFLRLGGYRAFLFHQGEESDYCIRMLDAGYVVRLGSADLIHHFESPKRDTWRMDVYGRRNDLLFVYLNHPLSRLPRHMCIKVLRGVWWSIKARRPWRLLQGFSMGLVGICKYHRVRSPVKVRIADLHYMLAQRGSARLNDVAKCIL